MDKLFRTRDEAVTAAVEWTRAQHDRAPFPYEDPLHAMWGLEVDTDKKRSGERDRFLYPRFDRPLEVVQKEVSAEELTQVMLSAKPGLYAQADDHRTRFLRACVYDLEKGISFVFATHINEVRKAQDPVRKLWVEKGFGSMPEREALGGYADALKAEFVFLWDIVEPILKERGIDYYRSPSYT